MPFKETQTLPANPATKILFHGLLFWGLDDDGKSCHIGVHRSSPDHALSIEVRIKKPDAPDFIIMRHLGPLSFLGTDATKNGDTSQPGLRIRINPERADAGVSKFIPTTNFKREPGSTLDPQDCRWGLDLKEIHNSPIIFDENCVDPGITITDGIIHTALKSADSVIVKKVSLKTGDSEDFYPLAALMGINIYLENDENLILEWIKDGLPMELSLPNPGNPPQVTYEIYIDNNPTFMNEMTHSDFREFYKAFDQDNLPAEQFDLDFSHPDNSPGDIKRKFKDSGDDLGTPTIPCMPGGTG